MKWRSRGRRFKSALLRHTVCRIPYNSEKAANRRGDEPIRSLRGTGESEQSFGIANSAEFLSVWKRFGATSQPPGVARLTLDPSPGSMRSLEVRGEKGRAAASNPPAAAAVHPIR